MAYSVALITPSYRNDLEYARDLCSSVDRHIRGNVEHILIVPSRDLQLFLPLATASRRVITKEAVMRDYGFRRLPIPTKLRIPGIFQLKQTERWYAPGLGMMNGWTVQQILKLSAPSFTSAELLLYVDSDVELFRDFDPESLWEGDRLKLLENREGVEDPSLQLWSRAAKELLGLPYAAGQEPFNYIGQLVPWLRSNVVKLQQRLQTVHGEEWYRVLARKRNFSEYLLYGIFCRDVLAAESGHVFMDFGLYNSIWTDVEGVSADALLDALRPSHVALHIQSTIPLPLERRRAIMKQVVLGAHKSTCLDQDMALASE
jgi:hypothetical protein